MPRSAVALVISVLAIAIITDGDQIRDDVTLRQVWDGGTLLQLMYSKTGEPLACEKSSRGPGLGEEAVSSANLTDAKRDCRVANIRHLRIRRATRHGRHPKPKHKKAKNKNHLAKGKKSDGEILRMPGTLWCGRGYSASHYRQLGPFLEADRCCRRHDMACPHYIAALSYGYGLYNWRPNTLMHCSCDRRFRTCLKMSGSTASNFVGKLFFNLVQTKCFVLKPERICIERNWWGKCQKTEMRKLAHIRTNMAY